ncbi:phosphatase PAP2 family protein [Winogradskyella vidalii]|uniref:phosphatase PAP2 family protein n=1 Tax=Winogradskyella vidalii TaxID=2615024 RepID=UPI0015CA5D4F|nr:phosphatase PAP2 family protein [Winogradskyella vidalii]
MQNEIKYLIQKCKQLLSALFKKQNNKLAYIIVTTIAILSVIGAVNLFVELTENLKTEKLKQLDSDITVFVHQYRTPKLTEYFVFITDVGDIYGYLTIFVLCIIAFQIIFKSWNYVIQLTIVMALALSSNVILKKIINRPRPELEHLVTVETLSYPSGHAMTAMAFYGFLIYLFYRFKINLLLKTLIIVLLTSLIISIGISRVYLGVHFPSDIIGGFIAGFIWVVLCALIFNLIKAFRTDQEV